MIQRLAPWQRLHIAIARGITLAPSGDMRWTAHVTTLTVRPQDSQTFKLIDFAADSEIDAARFAAEASAKRLYGEYGVASFVQPANGLYNASIGYYHNGMTKGCSLKILMLRYYRK